MVLINGCSFTSGLALHDPTCVYSVDYCNQNSLSFNNIATEGNSNDNIRSTTISELLTKDYKFAMVNWNTPWRLTLGKLISGQTPMYILPNHAFNGNYDDCSKYLDVGKFWEHFYDGFYYHRSYFESVYLLQEFCKSRKVNYVFTNTNNFMQVRAWQQISQSLLKGIDHPDTYINYFSESTKTFLNLTYEKLYRKNNMELIKHVFRRITCYVDAIDWNRFVGLDEAPFFTIPSVWPTELDKVHPGKQAHLYWRDLLSQTEWLNREILNIQQTGNIPT